MVNPCILLLGVCVLQTRAHPSIPSNTTEHEVGPTEERPPSYPETFVVLLPSNETSAPQPGLVLLALVDPRPAPNDTDIALNTERPEERDMVLLVAAEQSPEGNYTDVIQNTKQWYPLKHKVRQDYIRKRRDLDVGGAPLVRKKRTHGKHCKHCGMVMPILMGFMKMGKGGGGCGHGGCGQSYAPPAQVYHPQPCGQPACGQPMYHQQQPQPVYYHPQPQPQPVYYHPQPQPQPVYQQPQPVYQQPQSTCNTCGGSPSSGSFSSASSSSKSSSHSASWGKK